MKGLERLDELLGLYQDDREPDSSGLTSLAGAADVSIGPDGPLVVSNGIVPPRPGRGFVIITFLLNDW
jgi:hypothetical protein